MYIYIYIINIQESEYPACAVHVFQKQSWAHMHISTHIGVYVYRYIHTYADTSVERGCGASSPEAAMSTHTCQYICIHIYIYLYEFLYIGTSGEGGSHASSPKAATGAHIHINVYDAYVYTYIHIISS